MSVTGGGFREQIKAALGRSVEVVWETEFQARSGMQDTKEFRRRLEKGTDVIDIAELLSGKVRPTGPVIMVASLQRGGILVQVRELRIQK